MAWYRAGTVAVTNASAVVTGTGTQWLANAQIGLAFQGPDGLPYEISAVNSDTQITLAQTYKGATASGAAYGIVPLSGYVQTTLQLVQQFLTTYASFANTALVGKFPTGTAAAPGISFVDDQDTGLTRLANNIITIICGGLPGISIAAGRLGVGTSTPEEACDIVGNQRLIAAGTESRFIRIGAGRSGNGYSFLDLQSDQTSGSAFRILRDNTGANAASFVQHAGSGDLNIATLNATARIVFGTTSSRWQIEADGHLRPASDNAYDIGSGALRPRQYYGASTTISSSDARIKVNAAGALISTVANQIDPIPEEWLDAWGDVQWGTYRFADAYAEKGADARRHLGLIAQAVHAAFSARSIDATTIGLLCYDEWAAITEDVYELRDVSEVLENDEVIEHENVPVATGEVRMIKPAGNLWSLRLDECFAIEAAWHRREMSRMAARIAALEAA